MKYTTETRGTLKKLFPTCTQPSAKQIAAAQAFQKKQQDTYNANVAKANQQMAAPQPNRNGQPGATGPIAPPKNAEEREMRRCVSSGRLPASCTGNQLLGAFGQMLNSVASQVAPGLIKDGPASGPTMAGVFVGPGNWRLDFIDGGVLVNCSFLSPNQEAYSLDFKTGRAVLTINTTPRPLVLTFRPDNTITGPPGPVTIDGVVAAGYTPGTSSPGHTETSQTTTHETVSQSQAGMYGQSQLTYQGNGQYDAATTHTTTTNVAGASTPGYTNFAPKRATCSAINLSTRGATVGVQTMQTDLLKNMLGGDKGAPTPPGIRMKGIYADSAGFSVQFFPESAILGCGPDAARAYPYTVEPSASGAPSKSTRPTIPSPSPSNPTARSIPAPPALTRSTEESSPARTTTTTSPSRQWSRPATSPFSLPAKQSHQVAAPLQPWSRPQQLPQPEIPQRLRQRFPQPLPQLLPAQPHTTTEARSQSPEPPSATPLYPSPPDFPRNPALLTR